MKAVQDWGFISGEKTLPKPALQENKVFMALTSAYAQNQEGEVISATESIVRREKELCQMALEELRRVQQDSEGDETLGFILDHYENRHRLASEKESKLKGLSDDTRKLNEEHRKRNQELAEVKRNLLESQSKLRELAKVTEKLMKKEEELRFIEAKLKEELDRNRREMINGLYEVVSELSDPEGNPVRVSQIISREEMAAAGVKLPIAPPASAAKPDEVEKNSEPLDASLFGTDARPQKPEVPREVNGHRESPVAESPFFGGSSFGAANGATLVETKPTTIPTSEKPFEVPAAKEPAAAMPVEGVEDPTSRAVALLDRCQRYRSVEPSKTRCSKSLVKTPEGKVVSEYFFESGAARERRHYVFNTTQALCQLLESLATSPSTFDKRLEQALGDLSSRLDHSQNIHLEASFSAVFNRESLSKLMGHGLADRIRPFLDLCEKVIQRMESLGFRRAELLEGQFDNH